MTVKHSSLWGALSNSWVLLQLTRHLNKINFRIIFQHQKNKADQRMDGRRRDTGLIERSRLNINNYINSGGFYF